MVWHEGSQNTKRLLQIHPGGKRDVEKFMGTVERNTRSENGKIGLEIFL